MLRVWFDPRPELWVLVRAGSKFSVALPLRLTLKPEAITAFNVLKAEEGPRCGPRLAAEAIDLLLKKYGKLPVGWP